MVEQNHKESIPEPNSRKYSLDSLEHFIFEILGQFSVNFTLWEDLERKIQRLAQLSKHFYDENLYQSEKSVRERRDFQTTF